jgi:hypothetical protein
LENLDAEHKRRLRRKFPRMGTAQAEQLIVEAVMRYVVEGFDANDSEIRDAAWNLKDVQEQEPKTFRQSEQASTQDELEINSRRS